MKKILTITLLGFMILSGCGLKSDVKVLKLGHTLDTKHSVHIAMEFMAQRVAQLSDGKLQIQIYPGGVLGSERESLELLQLGSLDITKVSAAAMEGFVEEYKIFGLPYIFRDKRHAFSVLDGPIGTSMLAKGEQFWLRGLCFYDAGARSFYTSTPIHKPEDIKGLKIRVMQSITAVEMIKAMGGSATPVTWGELYTALQSKVVDGAENNPPSFYLSHHYEVSKYYTLNEHTMIPDVLIISTHAYSKLTDQEKEWLNQAVKESVVVQRKEWQKSEDESIASLIKEGVEIIKPDKQPFIDATKKVYDIYRNNSKVFDLVTQIRETENTVETSDTTAVSSQGAQTLK
ncbi:MAG TPA: TRAP transporter substrate-binding protein [Marinilabiliaceae bacterium]|nr:TRAP transporter substrate-binding protein [Marinilabiliaceae bacterium]